MNYVQKVDELQNLVINFERKSSEAIKNAVDFYKTALDLVNKLNEKKEFKKEEQWEPLIDFLNWSMSKNVSTTYNALRNRIYRNKKFYEGIFRKEGRFIFVNRYEFIRKLLKDSACRPNESEEWRRVLDEYAKK